jgi:hypothetical protein
MAQPVLHSYVFATELRVPAPERVWAVLDRHKESLVDLGAHYVYAYESTVDAGRVLVLIGLATEQPLLNLLRSRYLFEWFDALGVGDLPAVFAGETVERFEVGAPPLPGDEVVVAAVLPVDDIGEFMGHVRGSLVEFATSGIRRTVVYQAFDSAGEVMFLQQLASEASARRWTARTDVTADWLAAAGIGAYPPVFVGRFAYAARFPQPSGRGHR